MNKSELVKLIRDHHDDYDSDCGDYYGCSCGNGALDSMGSDNKLYPSHLADVILTAWRESS